MSESLKKLVNIGSFNILQDKLENWLDNYHYNTCDQNVARGCEIIELNAKVQGQLFKLLNLCASEGGVYGGASVIKNRLLPILGKGFFSSGLSSDSSLKILEDAASNKKNLNEIKKIYEKSLDELEMDLNLTKRENDSLKFELEEAKVELERQGSQSTSEKMFDRQEIRDLKNQLENIKLENSKLKTQAFKSETYKHEIEHLKDDVAILSTHRSPHCLHSPICHSPCDPCHSHGCSLDSCCTLHIDHCDPLCHGKYQHLVIKMNNLFSLNRLDAMNTLGRYSNDHENNQKIIFHSVMESFNAAKSAFRVYKSRVRTDLIGHSHSCSLEDSVQHYINAHAEIDVDVTSLSRDVVRALDFKVPLIRRPSGLSFDVIGSFIREACRIAWEMSSLPIPLDVHHPSSEGELYEEKRYRRSYDSEYSAAFVSHHIWPCLVKDGIVVAKGEAVTKRNGSFNKSSRSSRSPTRSPTRISGRSPSPSRISGRSPSPTRISGRSPSPTFKKSFSPTSFRSTSPTARRSKLF